MIVTEQPSTSTTKLEEGIVGVDGTNIHYGLDIKPGHKSVIQPFSRISPGEDLRPGLVLQDRTIVCWLNVLVNSEKGKIIPS